MWYDCQFYESLHITIKGWASQNQPKKKGGSLGGPHSNGLIQTKVSKIFKQSTKLGFFKDFFYDDSLHLSQWGKSVSPYCVSVVTFFIINF